MTLWEDRLSVLGGEEELMEYPPHIRKAFCSVGVYENNDDDFTMETTGIPQFYPIQPYYGDFMRIQACFAAFNYKLFESSWLEEYRENLNV
jgi:hypothetical protein